jgi:hypothetical protein
MARGFESKSVADQQESREQDRARVQEAKDGAVLNVRKRGLELARADVVRKLETAHAETHRDMLRKALAAVDADLAKLS